MTVASNPKTPHKSEWLVYVVSCRDGTLYTGITTCLARRLAEHNTGRTGARYTRSRRPVNLVYSEPATCRANAAKREWQIKKMSIAQKMALITAQPKELADQKTSPA
ncbi:MAG: GIY-YIG nuclease family protein [Desulfobulbaceae bacterium]|nr:GIY-YIG nuclease family protein [Desulfobulbaceae bacterium]